MPVLRPRQEPLVDAGLRPRFAPLVRVLRLAPLLLGALLRAALAPLVRLLLRPPFATTRERLVFALLRVERDFAAAADFVRPPVFLRAPAFAAGRPRLATPRFAPALDVVLLLLLALLALRPRLAPALERVRRPALARLPRRR